MPGSTARNGSCFTDGLARRRRQFVVAPLRAAFGAERAALPSVSAMRVVSRRFVMARPAYNSWRAA